MRVMFGFMAILSAAVCYTITHLYWATNTPMSIEYGMFVLVCAWATLFSTMASLRG